MKKHVFILIILFFPIKIYSQITFENSYFTTQLGVIKLVNSGYKYYALDVPGNQLKIYNINHSVYKNIALPIPPLNSGPNFSVRYISESTFDLDNLIEFAIVYQDISNNDYFIRIINENNQLLFSQDTFAISQIVNTDVGSKMILREFNTQFNRVYRTYSLPGILLSDLNQLNFTEDITGDLFTYPNPANNYIKIKYAIPAGEHDGELVILDFNGFEIAKYEVDDHFDDIILNTTEFKTGSYYCQLTSGNHKSNIRKVFIIK
jgi:hypothetical protein